MLFRSPDLRAFRSAHELLRDDPEQAMTRFSALANSGSPMSLVYIGYIHEEGLGVEKSVSRAEEFYRRAYERGSISGAFRLGGLSWKREDYKRAEEYFSFGAEKNDPRSMYWLACSHLRIIDDQDRLERAARLLERASSLGHLQSTRKLGKIFMRGHFGIAKFFHGLRLYISVAFLAARLAVDNPANERLLDLPLKG